MAWQLRFLGLDLKSMVSSPAQRTPVKVEQRVVPSHQLPQTIHPVLQRVLAARGVLCQEQLDVRLTGLASPQRLGGIDVAAKLLAQALIEHRHIIVVGDFDADGATGVALAVHALRALGATRVSYRVPNRFEFGYGLSADLFAAIAPDQPDLIMTVDNGIASLDGVAAARRAGVEVIVTDHHLPSAKLPEADAIVNPNLPGDGFPSKHLAGVGVMFYVLAALRAHLQQLCRWGGDQGPRLADFLDLVALGTVADLVPLDHNNRILVAQGLRRIQAGRGHPGIHALLEVAGRDVRTCSASDLAYAVAPRLNAAGRLDDMALGIECLLCADLSTARAKAAELDEMNRQRRRLQQSMQQQAQETLAGLDWQSTNGDQAAFCLFRPDWHQGIVGLVASHLTDLGHRPAIALAPDQQGSDVLKGSARSVKGYHIRDALAAIDAAHPGLIKRFGGHAAAAGLSLHRSSLETFSHAFCSHAESVLGKAERYQRVLTDGVLTAADLDLELADAIRRAGPWGQAFEEPLFEARFVVLQRRVVGQHHLRCRLSPVDDEGKVAEAVAFNTPIDAVPGPGATVAALCYLDINEYRGRRELQLRVRRFFDHH